MADLKGKVALVTGATSGLGLETAAGLAARGAAVILGVRRVDQGQKVAEEIKSRYPGSQVEVGPPLDLGSQDSVRAFAAFINSRPGELNILVNNAGIGYLKKGFTDDGVGLLAQVNHLGPYTLTRLVEAKLIASRARIVTVSSITHRITRLKAAKDFLTEWRQGLYQHCKLANVLFAYELQRRLGAHGVTSCAVDPGGVRTNIWTHSPAYSKGLINKVINLCYSPPEDGAKVLLHGATVEWGAGRRCKGDKCELLLPHQDLRYYARGAFTSPLITRTNAVPGRSLWSRLRANAVGISTVVHSLLDWPLRSASGGRLLAATRAVPSAQQSYDERLAAQLWELSAQYAGLPAAVQLP